MARNRTPRFMNLFSPERRASRTNRWRKRFPKFSLSSWHSSRIVQSVCSAFRAGAEASRAVRWATGSQVVTAAGSKSLRLEGLEERQMLTTTPWDLSTGDFSQDWSNTGLITSNDDWSGVPSIIGYRGDDLAAGTGVDPQTVLGPGSGVVDVNANQSNPNGLTTGGIAEFQPNVLFSDSFDSYANQAAFEAAWPSVATTSDVAKKSIQLATNQSVSAPNSVFVPVSTTATSSSTEYRNRATFAETGALAIGDQLVWSFDFYDNTGTGNPQRNYANLQDGAGPTLTNQLISMGLNNNQLSTTSGGQYYMARILGYNPPAADADGGPNEGGTLGSGAYFKLNDFGVGQRSAGWHNLKVVISTDDGVSTDYAFYVDGQLAERVSNIGAAGSLRSYENLTIGSGFTNGGVSANFDNMKLEYAPASFASNPVVALQGSGTAQAPSLNVHVNATGRENVTISYNLRDIDGSGDDSIQPIALQYRIGGTGDFINVPDKFVADASSGPNAAGGSTTVTASLPAWSNVADLEFRIITTNAVGSDEWIGIDDITVTSTDIAPAVSVFGPTMASEGSTHTYSFTVTDAGAANPHTIQYPSGVNFVVSNTSYDSNTQTGTFDVTFTDADAGGTPVNLSVQASDGVLSGAGSLGVAVDVVLPSVIANGPTSIEVGEIYSLSLSAIANPGDDTISDYVIDWGDGQQTQLAGAQLAAVVANGGTLNHVYAANGSKTITVSLTDEDGSVSPAAQLAIGVVDPPPGVVNVGGTDGPDTLVIDFAAGTYSLNGGTPQALAGLTTINYQGGNDADQLVLQGGAHGTVTYNYDNPNDGSVSLSGLTINYTGLEPIVNTGTATDVEFILTGGADNATLTDIGGGMFRLSGLSFEDTDFMLPTGSLTIRGGGDADVLSVASAASVPAITLDFETLNLAADLTGTLAGGANTANVNVQSSSVQLADAIALVAASGTIAVSASGTYTGDLAINKAVTLRSDVGTAAVIQGVGTGFGGAVRVTANNVTIGGPAQGFQINGAGESALYVVQGVNNLLVEDNTLLAVSGKLALLTEGGVSDLTFQGNTFDAVGAASQLVYVNGQASVAVPSTNVSFILNFFSGDASGPLLGLESTGGEVTGNQFNGSTPYTQLELWGAGNNVAANSFSGAGGGAYFLDPLNQYNSSTLVANNTFAAGTVTIERAGQFVEGAFSSIGSAIAAADPGDTIHVSAGTFDEDVLLDKDGLKLVGAGPGVTTIRGVIGGSVTTVHIAANNVEVAGLTITRLGNNTTDWNNPGLNSAGVAIQGGITGALIHDNLITGNRTGIDINNSSGHTVRNNRIVDNRTGMIFRNQTDNMTVVENDIADNWTVGILFLDASGGTNSPVQSAVNSTFSNNNISGNWYGGIVDRQAGGSLPAPGTNLKNFSGNWFGTATPSISTANSAEPGYAAQIPVAFGGTATNPGGAPDVLGPASANFDISPYLLSGTDTNGLEYGFQGDFSLLQVTTAGAQTGAAGRIDEAVSLAAPSGTIRIQSGAYAGDVDASQLGESVTLAPGGSPGQVTINGNLTLDGDDALAMEIDGTTAGSLYDQIVVTGTATLGGSSLNLSGSYWPVVGDTFTIIDASTISGTFGNGPFDLNGVPLNISYAGGDVVLSVSQPTGVWVDDDWVILVDNGMVGTLDYGDIVASDADDNDDAVSGLVFGYNAFSTIADGVDAVAIGGQVNVLAGTFTESVSVDKDLTILGQDAVESILNGGLIATPLTVTSGAEVVMDGMTVAGGIFGIDLDAADVTVLNSIVSGGSAIGILVDNGSTLTVEDSLLTGAGLGSGVAVVGGSADITGSILNGRTDGVIVGAGGAATLFNNDLSATFGNKAIQANPLAGVVDASGNWWGTTSESGVQSKVLGTIDFTPYLNSGANSATGVGFDGDFSHLHVTALGAQAGSTGRIQEGVNLVDAGGIVEVHAGTYTELVTVNKTVSLRGEQYGVDARTRAAVPETIVNGPGGSFSLQANDIELDGFTVQGTTGAPLGTGIHANSGFSGYRIANNIIQDNTIGLYLGSNGATQTVVEQNLIRDNDNPGSAGGTGVYSDQGLNNALIQDNQFAGNNFTAGMNLIGSILPVNNVTVTDNSFTEGNQLVLFSVDNSLIDGNSFTGTALAGTAIFVGGGSDNLTISDNTITNRAGSGISLSDFGDGPNSNATITGNIITQDVSFLAAGSPTTRSMISVSQTSGTSSIDNNQITLSGAIVDLDITAVRGIVFSGAATGMVNVENNTLGGGGVGTVGVLALSGLGGVVALEGNAVDNFITGVQVNGGTLDVESGNVITGGTTGLRLDGASVGLAELDLDDLTINGVSGDYITLANSAFDNQDLDGTGLTLDGVAVSAMTPAQIGAAENKITDELDDNTLGLVVLMANTIIVTPAPTPTATDNDYTRVKNAIEAASDNWTIQLLGTFDWTETNAAASWALGNDGVVSTADDYSIVVPTGLDNVTFTAAAGLGSARIQGPGDLAGANLEGVLVFDGGDNQSWEISDLEIFDFDLSIGFFNGAGGSDAFNDTEILNNHIRIATDLNATVAPIDVNQNIGIHYSFGTNQTIKDNLIEIPGTGVSDSANLRFASTVGMQSNTSGGGVYDGLLIDNNTINITGAQSADPENILGIWENAHGHSSNITVSNNDFVNLHAGNNPTLNLQRAFRVTSHSSGSSTVTYSNNTVSGANIGFQWLAGQNFAGNQAVQLTGNTLTNVNTGFLVQSNGIADFSGNSLTNSLSMVSVGIGIDIAAGSIATVDGSPSENVITGFGTGIRSAGTVTVVDNEASIHGNFVGVDVVGGTATISGNHIYNNGIGVRFTTGGGSIDNINFDGGATDNGTDLAITATAGAVTIGPNNSFAGDQYFIDNQSTQNYDLSSNGTTFDESNNFRIEDKIHHRMDTDLPLSTGLVTWVANNVYVTTPGVGSTDSSIQRGVDAAPVGGIVNVESGTYVQNSQLLIDSDVEVKGDNLAKPVITPGQNFTGGSAGDAWILVDQGVTFDLNNVVLDGDGFFVWQALRSHGTTTVDNVDFRDIKGSVGGSPYRGVAIQSYGGTVAGGAGSDTHGSGASPSHLIVTNSTFEEIGRIGVLVKGTGATALVQGNEYTGKGAGDWLDYGIEVGAGAKVDVKDNTITDNLGVASDGSTSAGLLITTFFGAGSEAHLSGANDFSGNTVGVHIGFDAADASTVTIVGGSFTGNTDSGIDAGGSGVKLKVAGADLTGNQVGIRVSDGAIVDAGSDNASDGDPTGLGNSAGGNILTGYTGAGGNYAIEDLNLAAQSDVYARFNDFGPYVDISIIEDYVFDDTDDPTRSMVIFAGALNQQPAPNVVYVDDDWAGTALGADADGAGNAVPNWTGIGGSANGTQFGVDQFASIQDAINAVAAGGSIYVYAGSYVQELVIGKTASLYGFQAGQDARATRTGGESVIEASAASDALIEASAAGVTIDGFSIDGGDLAFRAIRVNGVDNATVENNIITAAVRGVQYNGAAAGNTGGVVSQNLIEDMTVAASESYGVLAFDASYVSVTDNEITADVGVFEQYFYQPNGVGNSPNVISGNVINASLVGYGTNERAAGAATTQLSGNTYNMSGGTGVQLYNIYKTSGISLTGETITGADVGVYAFVSGGSVSITGGSIDGTDDPGSVGVHVTNYLTDFAYAATGNGDVTIDGVDIIDFAIGVHVEDDALGAFAVHATITNDTDIFSSGTAILVSGADASVDVTNNDNSISGNAVGVDVNGGSANVTNNHIFDNGVGVQFRNGGTGTVANNNFDDGVVDPSADNDADVLVQASAGAVTIGDGNGFAGDNYYIENLSSQDFDLSGHGAATYEGSVPGAFPDNFRIEDKMFHGPDSGTSGVISWVADTLFVTANGTGANNETIQNAINVADPDDTIFIEQGSYSENLSISKDINIVGVGNVTLGPAAAGNVITINGSGFGDDQTVSITNIDFNGSAGLAGYGIRVSNTASFANLTVDDSSFTGFDFNAIAVFGNATTGLSVLDVDLTGLSFTNNGLQGGGGTGDIQMFEYNGDATFTDLTLVGSATATTGARLGIQFRGTGTGAGVGVQSMGTVSLNNIDVSGGYRTQMIGIQRYSDVNDLSLTDVKLGGAGSEVTGTFGASLRFDAVGSGSLASPATVDLGNTLFRGLDGASAQRHEIEIAPDNGFTFLRADGTGTTWTIGGVDIAAASLTLGEAFQVEDRILHYVDKLNPVHGTYKGFVEIQSGQAFIGEDADAGVIGDGSIQRGVDIVPVGGTVNVEAGTFVENVTIPKNVNLLSQSGRASTTIQGISGVGALGTIVVTNSTTDVNIGGPTGNGFTIIGIDNGNPAVENAAVYFQGSHSGADIRFNDVAANGDGGLTTEFGMTITNFVIENNIFSGQTFIGTPADNGFANQFTTPNVPRQLVVMGGGPGSSQMTNLQFTNNLITGTAGGVNGGGEQGNSLVTVDGLNTTISGNTFSGTTTRFGASVRARGANNTITDNVFNSATMGAATVDVYVNRTGNVIQGNTFTSSAGAAIHVDNLGGATIGGTGAGDANSITGYSAGILLTGASASAVVDDNTITAGGVGVDVNAGTAMVQNADLNGNTIGVRILNGGVADLGQNGRPAPANFTGLGISAGNNDFSGYVAAASPTSGAIVNLNARPAVGREGAPPDVTAFGNIWAVSTPTGIENVVYHDIDDSSLGFVDYAAFAFSGAVTVSDDDVLEGDSVTVSGSFTNVPQPHMVTIDWGDGSAPTVINLSAGVFNFSAPHVYDDDQDGNQPPTNTTTYPITVTIEDASMATIVDNSLSVDVTNVTPTVVLIGPASSGDGQTQSYTFTTSDPGDDNRTPGELSLVGISATTLSGGATGTVSNIVFDPVTGNGSFDVTFNVPPGSGTVEISVEVADDDGASDVATQTVSVGNTLQVIDFQVTDSGFDVTFNRAIDLSDLNLYDHVNPLIVGDMLRAADIVVHAVSANTDISGSVVWNSATNTLSWVKTGGPLASDNYVVTLRSGSDAFKDALGNTLDGNGDFVAGDNYQQAFNVVVVGGTPIVSLPDFARGPGQGVDLTANSTLDVSLPVRATGTNVQGVNFELVYDTALLVINPLTVTAALPGWSVIASQVVDMAGIATLSVAAFALSPLNAFSGTANVVNIGAMVPSSTPYGASQILTLQNSEVNDDDAIDDAAFQKVMFPGDANGSGILPGSMPPNAYTGEDASLIARVVVGANGSTGFDATPLVDPVIVGDASGNGGLNAFDASLIAQEAAAFNTPEVPDETAPGSGGFAAFDPTLIIDENLFGNVGHDMQIPVKIAIEPTVVGVTSATFTVTFDPNVLTFVSAENGADFGAGWTVNANETPSGKVNVSMFSVAPSGNNGGLPQELAKLNFVVNASALGLQTALNVEPVDPNELGLIWTEDDGSLRGTFTADFDRDGDVDGDDLTVWENGYGTQPNAVVTQGDENGDGFVNGSDFLAWQQQVGSALPPSTVAAIPSSTTASAPAMAAALVAEEEPMAAAGALASPLAVQSGWWIEAPVARTSDDAEQDAEDLDYDAAFDAWSLAGGNAVTATSTAGLPDGEVNDVFLPNDDDAADEGFDAFESELDEALAAWADS